MPDETPPEGDTFVAPANQDEFDRMVGARLARERAKYADYDDLKAKASKFDEVDAASKSELQRAQDAIAERDRQLADLPKVARQQAIRFASLASQRGFLDPEDALVFIDADLGDEAAVKAALDDLATRKPHLVRQEEAPTKTPRTRPKPRVGERSTEDQEPATTGKERAADALRLMSSNR